MIWWNGKLGWLRWIHGTSTGIRRSCGEVYTNFGILLRGTHCYRHWCKLSIPTLNLQKAGCLEISIKSYQHKVKPPQYFWGSWEDTMHFEVFWKSSHIQERGGGRGVWLTLSNNVSIENNHNVEVWYNGTVSFRTPERTTSVIPHIISTVPHQISPAKVTADLDILARDALLKWLGLGKRQKVQTSRRVHLLVVLWGWRTTLLWL